MGPSWEYEGNTRGMYTRFIAIILEYYESHKELKMCGRALAWDGHTSSIENSKKKCLCVTKGACVLGCYEEFLK